MKKNDIHKLLFLKDTIGFRGALKAALGNLQHKDEIYIDEIKTWLSSEYAELLNDSRKDYMEWSSSFHLAPNKQTIWTLWWQGYEGMPEIVKKCFDTQLQYANAHEQEIVLLTKENIHRYVDIPSIITNKVTNGTITLTHLSDIIRILLLEKYGGTWLDSTLYIDESLVQSDFSECEFFSFHLSPKFHCPIGKGQLITECKWAGFMLYSKYPHHPLFKYLKKALISYWRRYDQIIDYFIMNFLIRIAYDNIAEYKYLIDSIEYNNPNLYRLEPLMSDAYFDEEWIGLKKNTSFFKLSWKSSYEKCSKEGRTTFYGNIMNV